MTKITIFLQVQDQPGMKEATLDAATSEGLRKALVDLGIEPDDEQAVFIDEADEPTRLKGHEDIGGLKNGARVHIVRCRKIRVTVNYLEKTADKTFAPGTRVRKVKAWAVKHFKLEEQDAAEHVLQLCNSTDRPKTDTPLHKLTDGKTCAVCFDLVPETRVEG